VGRAEIARPAFFNETKQERESEKGAFLWKKP